MKRKQEKGRKYLHQVAIEFCKQEEMEKIDENKFKLIYLSIYLYKYIYINYIEETQINKSLSKKNDGKMYTN